MQQMVRRSRIDLEGMAKAQLCWWNTCNPGKTFIDELRGNDSMFCFERIRGSEIIVCSCVDDDAGGGIDAPGKELIYKCAFHIDIAEDDAVKGIVEHLSLIH